MSIKASILLNKTVTNQVHAADWYAEVKKALEGKTECSMRSQSSNHEEKVEITK